MSYRYLSPREALRNYFVARRGPKAARPFWGDRSDSRSYSPAEDAAWRVVGRILRGPTESGGCGIEAGSAEDEAVRRWANETGETTWVVLRTERRLREGLRACGLMPPRQRVVRDKSGCARLSRDEADDDQ